MRRVTIADVAREAGVSKGTVSKILNGRYGQLPITPETVRRVREAARKLSYQPSFFARGLATKRSHLIGIVVRGLTSSFHMPLIGAIQQSCADRGYHVILGRTGTLRDQEEYARVLTQIGVDGIIIVADLPNDDPIIDELRRLRPLVGIFRDFADLSIPHVVADNADGVYRALNHLASNGHRRIGCLARRVATYDGRERLRAYKQFIAELNVPFREEYAQLVADPSWSTPDLEEAYRAVFKSMHTLTRLSEPPTAILAFDDITALQAMSAAQKLNFHIPDQLAIVGFGNFDFSARLNPPLTTVHIPVREIGKRAADRLIRRIEGVADADGCESYPMQLVVRESSGRTIPVA